VRLAGDTTVTRQGAMERRLLNDLFITRDYNKLERPVLNETEALTVEFGLTIQQIIDVVSITKSIDSLYLRAWRAVCASTGLGPNWG